MKHGSTDSKSGKWAFWVTVAAIAMLLAPYIWPPSTPHDFSDGPSSTDSQLNKEQLFQDQQEGDDPELDKAVGAYSSSSNAESPSKNALSEVEKLLKER